MMAVLMHIAGDAMNNIGVIIAAAVIWKAKYEGRFYADPAVSMGIAIMITLSGLPVGRSKFIQLALDSLLKLNHSQEKWPNPPRECPTRRQSRRREARPRKSKALLTHINPIQTNGFQVSGALSIHELHVWRLSQHKALASAHVFTTDDSLANFMVRAKLINECLHAYGIHSFHSTARAGSLYRRSRSRSGRRGCKTTKCDEEWVSDQLWNAL
jgi:zinc transporter 1